MQVRKCLENIAIQQSCREVIICSTYKDGRYKKMLYSGMAAYDDCLSLSEDEIENINFCNKAKFTQLCKDDWQWGENDRVLLAILKADSIKHILEKHRDKYRAQKKYDADNIQYVSLKLNKGTDAEIIKWLSKQESKMGAIKKALLKVIKEENKAEEESDV